MQVLGFDLLKSGIFSVLPWVTMALFANLGGWLADTMVSRGVSVTLVRKVMQTVRLFFTAPRHHFWTHVLVIRQHVHIDCNVTRHCLDVVWYTCGCCHALPMPAEVRCTLGGVLLLSVQHLHHCRRLLLLHLRLECLSTCIAHFAPEENAVILFGFPYHHKA